MLAQWTAEIVGQMHLYGISHKELASEVGVHPKYLSMILNGHRDPKNGEERIRAAMAKLIQEHEEEAV